MPHSHPGLACRSIARMKRIALVSSLLCLLPLLAACASDDSCLTGCCVYGSPPQSPHSACRGGTTCVWPPEKGKLAPGDVPLTPSLNKFLGCPDWETPRYTRAPFECDDGDAITVR
jgi:hypothetical protein